MQGGQPAAGGGRVGAVGCEQGGEQVHRVRWPSARGVGAAVVGILLIVAGTTTSILYVPMTGNRHLPAADRWHPLSRVQDIHYGRLEYIDSHQYTKSFATKKQALGLYATAYTKTWKQVQVLARRDGGLRRWLYKDFFASTLRQVPSTSIGLIVFEVVRRKYAVDEDIVKIQKDGYDILLS